MENLDMELILTDNPAISYCRSARWTRSGRFGIWVCQIDFKKV